MAGQQIREPGFKHSCQAHPQGQGEEYASGGDTTGQGEPTDQQVGIELKPH